MQEYRNELGGNLKDVAYSISLAEALEKLQARKATIEREGWIAHGDPVQLTENSKCTCGSGKKIKRCCRFIRSTK